MDLEAIAPWAALVAACLVFLWVDMRLFARGREPSFREGVVWSIAWLVISLLAALVVLAFSGPHAAIEYTTVYLIERSLSLDNLFVFILLFAYFGVPTVQRARLLFYGIIAALVLRGLAIGGGIALLEQFHFVIYVLGVLLLVLAYRILRGVDENVDPDRNLIVRIVRRLYPVTSDSTGPPLVRHARTGAATRRRSSSASSRSSFADIAFAVDSIPAAFAITRDPFLIWMGNVFALLGLRALFVLVEGLIKRFRYLDETIAIVLAAVAVKLLIEDARKDRARREPWRSSRSLFTVGIVASLIADSRDPNAEEKRRERSERSQRQDEGAES